MEAEAALPLLEMLVIPDRALLPPLVPTMTTSPPAWARARRSSWLRRSALTTAMVAPCLLAFSASEMPAALLTEIPSWRSSSATAIVPDALGLSMPSGVLEVVGLVHRATKVGTSRRARAMMTGRHQRHR